jgi:uncharacterized membrane protein YgcG
MKALYSSCGLLIRRNLKMVKKEAKWLELKKRAPELAFGILEEIVEEIEKENTPIASLIVSGGRGGFGGRGGRGGRGGGSYSFFGE